jgi:hypothetical protein
VPPFTVASLTTTITSGPRPGRCRDHAGRRDVAAIHVPGGELADLEEGRAGRAVAPAGRAAAACRARRGARALVRPPRSTIAALAAMSATSPRIFSALARKASEEGEIWDWMTGMRAETHAGCFGLVKVYQPTCTACQKKSLQAAILADDAPRARVTASLNGVDGSGPTSISRRSEASAWASSQR